MRATRARRVEIEQDFELNLAPIIDCFTVLITYLLVSASFISIGVFDVGGTVMGESTGELPKITLSVKMMTNDHFALELGGTEAPNGKQVTDVPASGGGWDYGNLASRLQELKSRWPDLTSVSIAATDGIEYSDLVKTIQQTREVFPGVAIGDQAVE